MIVLDAGVLIAHLSDRDVHHERAVRLFGESAGETLGANTISLAEAFVEPARAGRLREKTGLKLPDCCVLLAAKEIGDVVASFDSALAEAAASLGLFTRG